MIYDQEVTATLRRNQRMYVSADYRRAEGDNSKWNDNFEWNDNS